MEEQEQAVGASEPAPAPEPEPEPEPAPAPEPKPEPDALHTMMAYLVKRVEEADHKYRNDHTLCELCPQLKLAHELLEKE